MDGGEIRTRYFNYINDVVEANVALLSTSAADGRALNIGSPDTIEIRSLARKIRDQLAPSLELEYADRYVVDADHTHADIGRGRELLRYEPKHTIRVCVEVFIDWYRENRNWYGPLVRSS